MSKKDIIIIIAGLAILAAIILISYFLPEEQKEKNIDISTDKQEYTLGELLRVKIMNNTKDKVCFSTCYPYFIERKEENWIAYEYEDCSQQDTVDSCVESSQVKAFEFNVPVLKKGSHRLMIQACVACQDNQIFKKEIFT